MAYDRLTNAALPRALADVTADAADLVQKEIRLARAEIGLKISTKIQAGIWMSVAGLLGLIAALLLVQALVFAIASYGIAMHWASLIVAGVCAAIALAVFLKAKAGAGEDLTPTTTIQQVKRDIATLKEQFR